MDYEDEERRRRGAGGTPGGVWHFLIGLAMTVAGAYLLLPLIAGIAILFFNGKSIAGWLLLFAGVVIIFTSILMNLQIYFQPTSLFNTIIMLVLLAGGIGLIARSLRSL
jgi:hypothetical protein